ncbi:EAL domain-containing protein [Litoribacillus peritrichatus]|uniref:EAL domain-containing protein n=1 Tax=Litoribacillus peritrichatus TaxID=718191 RepID=A0ABP7MW91_9GAMM
MNAINQQENSYIPLTPRAQISGVPKVLIVDDLRENQRAIEAILEDLTAEFYTAYNGEEALSLTLRYDFAVILLDVMMPVMDGFETANLLRINQNTQHIPIIFITAADRTEEYEFKGYKAGAVDYLFKPIKPLTLESKVKVFLELEVQKQQLKKTLEDIDRLKRKNQLLLKSVGEGILGLDVMGKITFSNPAAQKLLASRERELENKSVLDFLILNNTEESSVAWEETEIFLKCSHGKMHHETLGVFRKKAGLPFPVEYNATPVYDEDKMVGMVLAFQDITERKRAEEQLHQLAQYDSLTGLNNRYSFQNLLGQSVARAIRNNSSIAVLFLDLDKFKTVNDSLGHEVGDFLLQEVALRIQACLRDGDVIGRIGGDEFTVILESISVARDIAAIAQKIIETISEPFNLRDHHIHIGVSIGIATYPESATDEETLMRCADIAMYKVKESGRNGYRFFTELMQKEVLAVLQMENRLRVALQLNQFLLYYQPKVDPFENKVVGFEALIRWRVGPDEFVSPGEFISKAEEMGVIVSIGNWIINESCRQVREWLDNGVIDESVSVAVNLSIKQMQNSSLVSTIQKSLDLYKLPSACIQLEITEGIMIDDIDRTIKMLDQFKTMGLKVSIDDFGTGYSSLNYLRRLPIDALKIDMSFVQALHEGEQSKAIVRAIISLSKNLGLTVIAEGVEDGEQLSFLKELECDLIQGYYFSKPLESHSVERFMKTSLSNLH